MVAIPRVNRNPPSNYVVSTMPASDVGLCQAQRQKGTLRQAKHKGDLKLAAVCHDTSKFASLSDFGVTRVGVCWISQFRHALMQCSVHVNVNRTQRS